MSPIVLVFYLLSHLAQAESQDGPLSICKSVIHGDSANMSLQSVTYLARFKYLYLVESSEVYEIPISDFHQNKLAIEERLYLLKNDQKTQVSPIVWLNFFVRLTLSPIKDDGSLLKNYYLINDKPNESPSEQNPNVIYTNGTNFVMINKRRVYRPGAASLNDKSKADYSELTWKGQQYVFQYDNYNASAERRVIMAPLANVESNDDPSKLSLPRQRNGQLILPPSYYYLETNDARTKMSLIPSGTSQQSDNSYDLFHQVPFAFALYNASLNIARIFLFSVPLKQVIILEETEKDQFAVRSKPWHRFFVCNPHAPKDTNDGHDSAMDQADYIAHVQYEPGLLGHIFGKNRFVFAVAGFIILVLMVIIVAFGLALYARKKKKGNKLSNVSMTERSTSRLGTPSTPNSFSRNARKGTSAFT